MAGEDFFDPDDGGFGAEGFGAVLGEGFEATAKFAAVAARVGETVDVVDAQAVDEAFRIEAEQGGVGCFKHVGELDADAGERVHVEEAAPVDFVRGGAPPSEPEILTVEEAVEAIAAELGGGTVAGQGFGDGFGIFGAAEFGAGVFGEANGVVNLFRLPVGENCVERCDHFGRFGRRGGGILGRNRGTQRPVRRVHGLHRRCIRGIVLGAA